MPEKKDSTTQSAAPTVEASTGGITKTITPCSTPVMSQKQNAPEEEILEILAYANNKSFKITLNSSASGKSFCGDGACDYNEDCANCNADCGCKPGDYCSSLNGVCYSKNFCGNNICSKEEKATGACCQDCGCKVTDKCSSTGKCFKPTGLSDKALNETVQNYLKKQGLDYPILGAIDELYVGRPAKLVDLDCDDNYTPSETPCRLIVVLDSKGNVIDELFST